eukprot:c25183_g1_i2 orf=483-1094(-)
MMLIAGMEERIDFYEVLGLQRNCLTSDVRSAYRKLAMKWHPDKCSTDNSFLVEQSKSRFQVIQEAYSVLSDENQRFLYDLGFYDEMQQQQENGSYGMGDFLGEMAALMTENKPNGESNLEELKELFMKILDRDIPTCGQKQGFTDVGVCSSGKRNWTEEYFQFSEVHASVTGLEGFQATSFCMGACEDSSSGTHKGKKRGVRR